MKTEYPTLNQRYNIDQRGSNKKKEDAERGIDIARRIGIRITDLKMKYSSVSSVAISEELYIATRGKDKIINNIIGLAEDIGITEQGLRILIKNSGNRKYGSRTKSGWDITPLKEKL